MSARLRPCSERVSGLSSGRARTTRPSSCLSTVIGSVTVWCSVPFGPLTVTSCPSIVTSTPLGTETGSRPIRDMLKSLPLPDVGEDFAAHAALLGLLVRHQATGRRNDRDAEAAQDAGQVLLLRVDPEARLGDPADAGDGALPGGAVLQLHHEVLAHRGVLGAPALDVALLLEDLGDVRLDLGIRHRHGVVVSRIRVAQTRQHVCD